MTVEQVITHIRSLLKEPLEPLGAGETLMYTDEVLLDQIQAALFWLSAVGVSVDTEIVSSEFNTEPTTRQGVLIALRVTSALLRGDITQRVMSGSLGMIFRMGNDLIDTKTAATQLKAVATDYLKETQTLLIIELSPESEVFGGPKAPGA